MHKMYNINDYTVKLDELGKIIIYLRKSREDMIDGRYASDEETLARHEEQLQQWAKINLGHEIPADCIYKEVGSGEKIKTRPVFQEVLRKLENEPDIEGILVVNCSRLSRGDLKDCGTLMDTLKVTNTLVLTPPKIYNLKDKYDYRFFKDELLRGNDYLEQTKELLSNGRHWSVSQGKYVFSVAPFGYDRVTCKEMNVSDGKGFTLRPNANAEYVKLIFEMYAEGNGCFKIASHLKDICAPLLTNKKWDHCKVRQIIENVTYNGFVTYGKQKKVEKIVDGEVIETRERDKNPPTYKGLHTAIIPPDLWEKVQARLNINTAPVRHNFEQQNPFAGIVKCGVCGHVMVRKVYNEYTQKRKHPLNLAELQDCMKQGLNKSGLTLSEFARRVGFAKSTVHEWVNTEKFNASKKFTENWQKIKDILQIEVDRFDAAIYEFEAVQKPATLTCNGHKCKNISANLDRVEDKLFDIVSAKLKDYRFFVDNYAEEITKKVETARKATANIDKQISLKEKQLKNAKIAYEQGADSLEEYIERKQELNAELKELIAKKENLSETQEEEKTVTIKKAVPILENVIADYYSLTPAEKNELLKTLISSIEYVRVDRAKGADITLDICWLI